MGGTRHIKICSREARTIPNTTDSNEVTKRQSYHALSLCEPRHGAKDGESEACEMLMTLRSFWRTEAPSHPKISFPFCFPLRGGGVWGGAAKNGKEILGVRPPER